MENITVQISAKDMTHLMCHITCCEMTIERLKKEIENLKKQLEEKENEQ